jgi:DNA-binding YbaB/EbfC family protein
MDMREMMERAKEMQQKAAEMQRKMAELEAEGVSGGGMVRVVLGGNHVLKRVQVDPSLMKPDEREILEDLIVAAHGDAKAKLEERMAKEMSQMAGKLGLPPGLLG